MGAPYPPTLGHFQLVLITIEFYPCGPLFRLISPATFCRPDLCKLLPCNKTSTPFLRQHGQQKGVRQQEAVGGRHTKVHSLEALVNCRARPDYKYERQEEKNPGHEKLDAVRLAVTTCGRGQHT